MRSWLAYFWSGAIALIVSWALSAVLTGCRLGNHVVQGPNPDQYSGYYQTQPQTLRFCASKPAETCASANTSQVPALISGELSNPVALIVQDLSSGFAFFVQPGGQGNGLPVVVNPDFTLSYAASSAAATLWKDPACSSTTYLEEAGQINRGTGGTITVNGSSFQAAGRISLHVQVIQSFTGSCAQTLQDVYNCIQDVTKCQGASPADNQLQQAQMQSLFNPYIQAGVMSAADIPKVTNLAYEAQYD